jgi:hypothetical protein
MSVRVAGDIIHIEGTGSVADAEPLLAALLDDPSRAVDLSGAARLHSAIIQLFLALRPRIIGAPADLFHNSHIVPLLDADEG